MSINLDEKKTAIVYAGNKLFTYLVKLPQDVRPDKQKRTGIQVFAKIIGTRNQVSLSVKKPSKDAKVFAVEKSVRTECYADKTSWNSRDVNKQRYGGCVSIFLGEYEFHVSVSGLKEEEDVCIAIIIMSKISGIGIDEILHEIKEDGGEMPEGMYQAGHYLNDLLNLYRN